MFDLPEPKLSIIKLYIGEKVEITLPNLNSDEYRMLSESCENYMMTYYPFLYTTEKEVDLAHVYTLQSSNYKKEQLIINLKEAIQIYHRYGKSFMLRYAYDKLISLENDFAHIRERKRNYPALLKKYPTSEFIHEYYYNTKMLMYDENKYSATMIRYNSDLDAYYLWITKIFREHYDRDEIIDLINSITPEISSIYQRILLVLTKCKIQSKIDNIYTEYLDNSYISKLVNYAISYTNKTGSEKFGHDTSDPYLSYHHYILEMLQGHVDLHELLKFSKIHGLGDIEYVVTYILGNNPPSIDILYNATTLFRDDLHKFALYHYSNDLYDEMKNHDYKIVNNKFNMNDDDFL